MPGDALEVIATLVIVIAWALRAILSPLAKRQEEKRQQQAEGQHQPAQHQRAQRQTTQGQGARRQQGPQRHQGSYPARSAEPQRARPQPQARPKPAPATIEAGKPIQPAPPPQPSTSSREKAPERPLPAHEGTRSLTAELLRELGMEIEKPSTGAGGTRDTQGVPGEQLISGSGDLEVVELAAPPPLIGEEPSAGDIQAPRLEVLTPGAGPKGSTVSLAQEIRRQLYGGPRSLGQAVLLAEILGQAPGLRPPGVQSPGENSP
ncbi:MAG: hypothetical protein SX243_05190 [Acidobacteriota bacterium]|nr:hypothetical protein [Acidobacteriota bacterium]